MDRISLGARNVKPCKRLRFSLPPRLRSQHANRASAVPLLGRAPKTRKAPPRVPLRIRASLSTGFSTGVNNRTPSSDKFAQTLMATRFDRVGASGGPVVSYTVCPPPALRPARASVVPLRRTRWKVYPSPCAAPKPAAYAERKTAPRTPITIGPFTLCRRGGGIPFIIRALAFKRARSNRSDRNRSRETHVSTAQQAPQAHARISQPDVDEKRPARAGIAAP